MKKSSGSSGISVLELLIGLGIMALVMMFATRLFLGTQKSSAQSDNRLKLRSVARTIETQVDCANAPKICTDGQVLAIPKRNSGILIANDGSTVMAGWSVRAFCTGKNQYKVQVARIDAAGKFSKDPVSQQPLDWDHPGSTIFPEKTLCFSPPQPQAQSSDALFDTRPGQSCIVNQASDLPCTPPQPPACGPGFSSRGLSMDTFGGDDDPTVPSVFGQRWIRYCGKDGP